MASVCYPHWHDRFKPYRGLRYSGGYTVPPVDQVDASLRAQGLEDFVPIDPETLRANAERKLRELGLFNLFGSLPLDVYSLARNISTETGSGTPEEKMAVALTTINQAARRRTSVHKLVTLNNRLPNRYGRIHAHGDTSSAPYGRFTASSKEPSIEELLIAKFAIDGGAGRAPNDFVHGADDQAQVRSEGWMTSLARAGSYWIGHLPGVNPAKVTIFRKSGESLSSPEGQALLARGLKMLLEPPGEFVGQCVAKAPGRGAKIFAAIAGAAALGTATVLIVSSPKSPKLVKRLLRR